MNMDETEERWREKYYDKCAELNILEGLVLKLETYIKKVPCNEKSSPDCVPCNIKEFIGEALGKLR